ncbi:MAG TPA: xanthine dehydrogenase family protein subunit M [Verrucomicrobiae bacterium]|nr:xanthine dehydrogenase family protein subunit M [Verrucomicrobiae bacterium]
MIPAPFSYLRPASLEQALGALASHEDAKILAGGHSLLPAMKLRLAQPRVLIDLSRVTDLKGIREDRGQILLGAMATHYEVESSPLLRKSCPLLPEVAAHIGDVQVRNRGTIGGSLVHADPAADWPAAILALDAEMEVAGPGGRRLVKATDFFTDMMQVAIQPNEILCSIRVPSTAATVAYVKFAQKASGFAIAGVAAVVNKKAATVQVGITGVAPKPYRAGAVEEALRGQLLTSNSIAAAAEHAADEVETLNDIHASADYRAHLALVNTRRALELAASR